MSLCWPLQMPPTAKAVLISLAENANDQGSCWPSIPTIAMRTCFSERAVQGAIKWLEQVGILKANRSNGRHTSYVVTPENYTQPPQELRRLDVESTIDTPAGNSPPQQMPPAANAPTPAGAAPVPPQELHQPPQQVPSNHHKPSLEPSKNRQKKPDFDPIPFLEASGVDQQTADDWIDHRKAKKAKVSQTVLDAIAKQAGIAGIPLAEALKMSCQRGWIGFEASWMQDQRRSNGHESKSDKLARTAAVLTGRHRDDPRTVEGFAVEVDGTDFLALDGPVRKAV